MRRACFGLSPAGQNLSTLSKDVVVSSKRVKMQARTTSTRSWKWAVKSQRIHASKLCLCTTLHFRALAAATRLRMHLKRSLKSGHQEVLHLALLPAPIPQCGRLPHSAEAPEAPHEGLGSFRKQRLSGMLEVYCTWRPSGLGYLAGCG